MAKETVIIVHGTWAAPEPNVTRWYQRGDGAAALYGFTTRLDTALETRRSAARCWAHCDDESIFHWSGENNWVARATAASALAEYVLKLQSEGWLCHIIGHSHGGNVIVEALQHLIRGGGQDVALGRVVTLGTPFMDVISPIISKSNAIERRFHFVFGKFVIILLLITVALVLAAYVSPPLGGLVIGIGFNLLRSKGGDIEQFNLNTPGILNTPRIPFFLAINSQIDETWQLLHHLPNLHNPIAVKKNIIKYLIDAIISRIKLRTAKSKLYGAKTYSDFSMAGRAVLLIFNFFIILYLLFLSSVFYAGWSENNNKGIGFFIFFGAFFAILFFAPMLIVLFFVSGENKRKIYSALMSPFRFIYNILISILNVGGLVGVYFIRRQSWPVLLRMAMGLEDYRQKLPMIDQCPTAMPKNWVRYETIPLEAKQRAMNSLSTWLIRQLGDLTETFSRLAITTVDLSALLRSVESDQTLIHGVYYTDDACIAQIADWIATIQE
jgi:hypothetical protein